MKGFHRAPSAVTTLSTIPASFLLKPSEPTTSFSSPHRISQLIVRSCQLLIKRWKIFGQVFLKKGNGGITVSGSEQQLTMSANGQRMILTQVHCNSA